VLLAVFIPVLSGQCSNNGCQALAVTLRGMTLNEVQPGSALRLMGKEAWLGFLNGALTGVVAGIVMYVLAVMQKSDAPLTPVVIKSIELIGVREQITDAPIGETGNIFKMRANTPSQAGDLLWQDDAELGDETTQTVVGRGAFFDKTLPRAVQAEDDLLVFFLDRDEAHMRSGNGFADGGRIRCVVLAALATHAVRGDELRGHQFDGVAVLTELSGPVVGARAGFDADQAWRQLGNQR